MSLWGEESFNCVMRVRKRGEAVRESDKRGGAEEQCGE